MLRWRSVWMENIHTSQKRSEQMRQRAFKVDKRAGIWLARACAGATTGTEHAACGLSSRQTTRDEKGPRGPTDCALAAPPDRS